MGCDIHGFWELYHPEFKRWVAFRDINCDRSYTWFGILSGVRGPGPKVRSYEEGPRHAGVPRRDLTPEERAEMDDPDFSAAWCSCIYRWGSDLHSFTVVPYDEVKRANVVLHEMQNGTYGNDDEDDEFDGFVDPASRFADMRAVEMEYHENVPKPEDIVVALLLEMDAESNGGDRELPMNLPLGEIVGTYDPAVLAERVRMVVAYDN